MGSKKDQTGSVGQQICYKKSLQNWVSKSHASPFLVTMRYIELLLLLNSISHYLLTLGETYSQKA